MNATDAVPAQKAHRASRTKKKKTSTGTGGKKNAVAKPGAFARRVRLAADRSEKRAANPAAPVDRTRGDAAPRIAVVVGPSGVGKSTIIRNLVKHYSKRNIPSITGPITLVSGCRKRITFMEIGSQLASMIDAAKIADLVLVVIDASFGFEMETFEFLNILAAHGMPKVITVLTHLDKLSDGRQIRRAKKTFKDRIWAELYDGAKVFYLSGITTAGDYLSREILNLARFISVSKYPVLRWRAEHPYILADRVEDITPQSLPSNANRTVAAYGYVRGTPLRSAAGEWHIHLAGVADLVATNIESLPDPCPPPESATEPTMSNDNGEKKRRKVSERERILYAPMAPEVDGIAYERDAVYINLNPENIRFSGKSVLAQDVQNEEPVSDDEDKSSDGEGEKMVKTLQKNDVLPVDDKLKHAQLQLVKGGKFLMSENFDSKQRRAPIFSGEHMGDNLDSSSDNSSSEGDDLNDDNKTLDVSLNGGIIVRKGRFLPETDERGSEPDDTGGSEPDDTGGSEPYDTGGSEPYDTGGSEPDDTGSNEEDSESESDVDSTTEDKNDENAEFVSTSSDDEVDEDAGYVDDDGAEDEEDENEFAAKRWKDIMIEKAEKNIKTTVSASKALAKFIYEKDANGKYAEISDGQGLSSGFENADDDEDAFFRPRRKRAESGKTGDLLAIPGSVLDDITRLLPNSVRDWVSNESLCNRLKQRRWGTGQNFKNKDDNSEEEIVDGDFEDLETGEIHRTGQKDTNDKNDDAEKGDPDKELDVIRAEKIRQKEMFNVEWDQRGPGRRRGEIDEDGDRVGKEGKPNVKSRKALRGEAEREPDFRKLERERADKLKNEELQHMDPESRMAIEGLLPGQYVRLELQDVPVEFVKYFDPNCPIVLGGLRQADDEGQTYLRARVRRHRFKRGVLKSNDPIVFSIGWRRFQSIPVYDTEDLNGRRRYLKYTPEHLHCNATFWGPSVGPGAGLVMCQSLGRERTGFRVAATGIVTEVDAAVNVVKKLKLVGEAVKVHRNTAFIKGMFNSELEASKYIGAAIRTVSGVRGTIKKSISEASQRGGLDRDVAKAPSGTFRATFEDRILLSDVVFLRTWISVDVAKFCSMAETLLDEERNGNGLGTWRMRTIREIREAKGLAIPLRKDSLYTEVQRGKPIFAPLKVPKAIEGSLPFATKAKQFAPLSKNKVALRAKRDQKVGERRVEMRQERAIIADVKERKERQLLQAVYNIRKERTLKRKEVKKTKLSEKVKGWKREEAERESANKGRLKRKFALDGSRESHQAKRSRKNGNSGDEVE